MKCICKFCNRAVDLFKHVGNCVDAAVELDENLKSQSVELKAMTPVEVEYKVQEALQILVAEFVKKHGKHPPAEWMFNRTDGLRERCKKLRGEA